MTDRITHLVVATTNNGKLNELRQLLAGSGLTVHSLAEAGISGDCEETGVTFEDNARQKALFYSCQTDGCVLADDSGLEVDALGGAPGVYSARFAGVEGPSRDQANNHKLLERMQAVPDEMRTARFRCCLCLAQGGRVLLEVSGKVEGVIGREPRGENGFGYDPLFYIPTEGLTAAQLSKAVKNRISHRGQAFQILARRLRELIE